MTTLPVDAHGTVAVGAEDDEDALVRIRDLHVEVDTPGGASRVLSGVSLAVRQGESLGLVGESGSGKSMTVMSILGLLPPGGRVCAGSIRVAGVHVEKATPAEVRRLRGDRVGTILQDPTASLNPVIKVGRQVGEPLQVHRAASRRGAFEQARVLLDAVGIQDAANRVDDFPHQFSGGMQQRIVGAAAMACEPSLLIADEPTTALDVTVQAQYLDFITDLRRKTNVALLFVSHDLGVVSRVCDRVAVMYAGQIVEVAGTAELMSRPRHPYTQGLLNCVPRMERPGARLLPIAGQLPDTRSLPKGCLFAARCPFVQERCLTSQPPLAGRAAGHEVACWRADEIDVARGWAEHDQDSSTAVATPREAPPRAAPGHDTVLRLDHVRKSYTLDKNLWGKSRRVVEAVQNVSLDVRAGRTLALVGESGSGKSTCLRLALGLEPVTSGRVLFEDRDISELDAAGRAEYRRDVQSVFQNPYSSLNPRRTIVQAVAEPLLELPDPPGRKEVSDRVNELLHHVGIPMTRSDALYPHALSGGQRQRVAIARALVTNPRCILLDEPTSALDVSVSAQIMNLLRDIQEQTGVAFLFISHDLAAVRYLSDDVAVIRDGEIVERGTAEDVYEQPQHPYTRSLLADAVLI